MTVQSMQQTIDETERRRAKQLAYNELHHIQPKQIVKAIAENELVTLAKRGDKSQTDAPHSAGYGQQAADRPDTLSMAAEGNPHYGKKAESPEERVERLRRLMKKAAADFDFVLAAQLRDELKRAEALLG